MARNNFQYEKRQRELEKKRKADDKARRKLEPKTDTESVDGAADDDPAALTDAALPGDSEGGSAQATA